MPRELRPNVVRDMSKGEIEAKISELRGSLFNLRFRNTMKQLDNPLEIRHLRKDIAVLRTVLREHETGLRKLNSPEGDKD